MWKSVKVTTRLWMAFLVTFTLCISVSLWMGFSFYKEVNLTAERTAHLLIERETVVRWLATVKQDRLRTEGVAGGEGLPGEMDTLKKSAEEFLVHGEEASIYQKASAAHDAYIASKGKEGTGFTQAANEYESALEEVVKATTSSALEDQKEAHGEAMSALSVLAVLLLVAGGLSTAVFFALRKAIVVPLKAVSSTLERMESGDLKARCGVVGSNEFGALGSRLDKAIEGLSGMVTTIVDTGAGLKAHSIELKDASVDLSVKSSVQAANLEETAAALEELSSSVKNTADNSVDAAQLSQKAVALTSSAVSSVADVVAAMGQIREASAKIEGIVTLIKEISAQINILSLNAAIEAARAGDAGKGFAVVAQEVRTLARRTSKASGDIQEIVGATYLKLGEGTLKANNVAALMGEVANNTKGLVTYVDHMAHATQEQSAALSQVSESLASIDEATQRNAGMAEQMSSTVESLRELTEVLGEASNRFNAGEHPLGMDVVPASKAEQAKGLQAKKVQSTGRPALVVVAPSKTQETDGFGSF